VGNRCNLVRRFGQPALRFLDAAMVQILVGREARLGFEPCAHAGRAQPDLLCHVVDRLVVVVDPGFHPLQCAAHAPRRQRPSRRHLDVPVMLPQHSD